jgi:hypothetical protein
MKLMKESDLIYEQALAFYFLQKKIHSPDEFLIYQLSSQNQAFYSNYFSQLFCFFYCLTFYFSFINLSFVDMFLYIKKS